MAAPKYSINDERISTLLTWVRSGEIAIPEIQRPFVWKASKVRDLLDSLLQGFPVGYMIMWRNPDVKLKDGSVSTGKRILIDGQQRMTAMMAALLGYEVVTKSYQRRRIVISYHPIERRFEVLNSAIKKDTRWIPDISAVFAPEFDSFDFVHAYCEQHGTTPREINASVTELMQITNNSLGIIELASALDIETVTEIFIRVNSEGVPLSQADFAMSKIAVNERHGGTLMRKAVDYFCHLAVAPEFYPTLQKHDTEFAATQYFQRMSWLRKENDDLYDPSYTDMLRVSFSSEFRRGRLEDLVALLSGRNFETREYEDAIVEDTFSRLHESILNFMNETHFKRFIMIIRSAGFIAASMIRSQNALNFAYILYLTLRRDGVDSATIERYVRRWYVMSVLTGRYSSSPESQIDFDIRRIDEVGIEEHAAAVIDYQLSDAFWEGELLQGLQTSVASSPYWHVFRAAQVKMNDRGFLSRDLTVRELVEYKSDVHHIFPRDYLKREAGMTRGQYNQIANYVIAQTEINIAISNKPPHQYFKEMFDQVNGGSQRYGNIEDVADLRENLEMNCIPEWVAQATVNDYADFLDERRQLMAQKIHTYFDLL